MIAEIIEHAVESAVELPCYALGRLVIPLVSLGRLKCDPVDCSLLGFLGEPCGYVYKKDGQTWVSFDGILLVGFVVAMVGISVVAWVYWLNGFFD